MGLPYFSYLHFPVLLSQYLSLSIVIQLVQVLASTVLQLFPLSDLIIAVAVQRLTSKKAVILFC